MSRLCMEAFEVCYTGGIHIEKQLNELLMQDNKELARRHPILRENLNFPSNIIEDMKTRTLFVMQKDQKDSYLSSEENITKMKRKIVNFGKLNRDYPGL